MRSLLLLFLLLTAATQSFAQSTEADIKARILHKPLYLRGFWHDDTLHFDPNGTLIGSSAPTTFTLAGIDVTAVHLEAHRLIVEGDRTGLELAEKPPKRVVFSKGSGRKRITEQITIEIDPPASGDYTPALDSIFLEDLAQLPALVPTPWVHYVQRTLMDPATPPSLNPLPPGVRSVGDGVLPPTFRKQVEPAFTPYARALLYTGVVLLHTILTAEGRPTHIEIVRALGLGLDEQAILAMQQSTFNPATEDGKPVPFELQFEIAFRRY